MPHAPPSTFPRPEFWRAFADERFALPYCSGCQAWQPFGAATCPRCGSDDLAWRDAGGNGSVHSLMERHGEEEQPLYLIVVDLDEGPRVMCAAYAPAGALRPGARVAALAGAPPVEGLPLFRAVSAAS